MQLNIFIHPLIHPSHTTTMHPALRVLEPFPAVLAGTHCYFVSLHSIRLTTDQFMEQLNVDMCVQDFEIDRCIHHRTLDLQLICKTKHAASARAARAVHTEMFIGPQKA